MADFTSQDSRQRQMAAVLFREEDGVVLTGVEGWIEVDEVNRLVGDGAAQDFEVVAVVELVEVGRHSG